MRHTTSRSSGRSPPARRRRRLPCIRSDARSDPAPGSEKPWHHTTSPRRIGAGGRGLLLVGAVGDERRAHRGCCPTKVDELLRVNGGLARANSSYQIICWMSDRPRPPYSVGQLIPAHPPSNRVRCQARSKARISAPSGGRSSVGRFSASHVRASSRNDLLVCGEVEVHRSPTIPDAPSDSPNGRSRRAPRSTPRGPAPWCRRSRPMPSPTGCRRNRGRRRSATRRSSSSTTPRPRRSWSPQRPTTPRRGAEPKPGAESGGETSRRQIRAGGVDHQDGPARPAIEATSRRNSGPGHRGRLGQTDVEVGGHPARQHRTHGTGAGHEGRLHHQHRGNERQDRELLSAGRRRRSVDSSEGPAEYRNRLGVDPLTSDNAERRSTTTMIDGHRHESPDPRRCQRRRSGGTSSRPTTQGW